MNSILIKKEPVLLLQSKTQTESSTEENKHANPQTNGAEHKKALFYSFKVRFRIRGTQRLFSVSEKQKYCLEFFNDLRTSQNFSCTIFEAYLINSLRFSEV